MCFRSAQVPSESLLEHLILKIFLGNPPYGEGATGPPLRTFPWDAFGVLSGASRHILSLTKFLGTPPPNPVSAPDAT